jgi:hypothetical protein
MKCFLAISELLDPRAMAMTCAVPKPATHVGGFVDSLVGHAARRYSLMTTLRMRRRRIGGSRGTTTVGLCSGGCWVRLWCGRFSEGRPELEAEISVFALLKG